VSSWDALSFAEQTVIRAALAGLPMAGLVQAYGWTMRWGGVIILLFVFYHLAHLTLGMHVAPQTFVENDPYHNVVAGFQVWWVAAIYIIANLALGLHLYHGVWSMFQTVGVNRRKYNRFFRGLALVSAVLIAVGGCVVPVAVLTGIVS